MSRIIAIDYGNKRVGVATTDPLQITTTALGTFTPDETVVFLQSYLQKEEVSAIVVGDPLQMNGTPSQSAQGAQQFAQRIQNKFSHIKVERYDERFTSKIAMQAMVAGGASKKQRRDKSLIDQVSACVILQSYLEYKHNFEP
ncbi:putative pre-16S rRNA nuclease [Bacteroidia bacterium]|nr:putative pre-16S rRNA nuclease [Bacteroidia bacterium]GHT81358.1 putative pre-16S rRNA nuclease [Bacteroidia bacterium]